MIGALFLFGATQAAEPQAITGKSGPDSGGCAHEGPALTDSHGQPTWLDTDALVRRVKHCVAPTLPGLARQARLEGYVFVDILVDESGRVACAQVVSGHPIFIPAALQAAKDWTFRPERQGGRPVSVRGHLRFHFSPETAGNKKNSCT